MSEVTLHNDDCLTVMRGTADKSVDAVITDPPYGIGKAEWDAEFNLFWIEEAARLTDKLVVMPGVWNLPQMPVNIGDLVYKWTLAAHLTNGMTRGGVGFGNWIPVSLYTRATIRQEIVDWCADFTDWCIEQGITKARLNEITGTSDMGGWWMSKLPHRCSVPAPAQWKRIKLSLSAPDRFDALVSPSDYAPIGDCKDFAIGLDDKPDHPSPKPLGVMRWIVDGLTSPGDTILDPFMGSGTTGVACVQTGRNFIGCEIDAGYFAIAKKRIEEAQLQVRMGI